MTTRVSKRRVGNVVFILALSVLLGGWYSSSIKADASTPTNAASPDIAGAETEQQEKTVEQVRKNIQVLKGLPDSQLFPVMNFIGDSLGVHCDYCHMKQERNPKTGSDEWLWERDDKPQKVRARAMMRMVLDINKTSFGGDQAVTCYSCHRGALSVGRLVPLPPPDFAGAKAPEKSKELPTAEQILNKYIKAVLGQKAGAKFDTITLIGTYERSQGRKDPVEVTLKGPDRYLLKLTTPQGVIMQGTNGSVGWVKNSDRVRQLAAADMEQLKRSAALYSPVKVTGQPGQMIVLGLEKIRTHDAYVVALKFNSATSEKYYFDAQTGLLLRIITTTNTMLVPLPEQVDFEDYKDVDGIKLPFSIRTSDVAAFDTTTRRFTDVRHSVSVDDAIFNMPAR